MDELECRKKGSGSEDLLGRAMQAGRALMARRDAMVLIGTVAGQLIFIQGTIELQGESSQICIANPEVGRCRQAAAEAWQIRGSSPLNLRPPIPTLRA